MYVHFAHVRRDCDSQYPPQLYGKDLIRPNHHYATDVPDCLRDLSPMVSFWTFLSERLNKNLKSYHSASHAGGELGVSFFSRIPSNCTIKPLGKLAMVYCRRTQLDVSSDEPSINHWTCIHARKYQSNGSCFYRRSWDGQGTCARG
jgi:hypothetical protein